MEKIKWKVYIVFLYFIHLSTIVNSAQQPTEKFTLRGTVRDDKNEVLPSVFVSNHTKKINMITNEDGQFSTTASIGDTLIFSHISFTTQTVIVKQQSELTIRMAPSSGKELDAVVVIGYGTTKKSDLTGSIGEVDMEDIKKAPVASVTEGLAGRIAGVQVSGSDAQPGQEPNIVIRGTGSLTQNTSPLYVVDGFPIESLNLGSLSPNDIESITVLKDASATAIYGARAANGVIVIETKMGKAGKTVISFNSSIGRQEPQKTMDLMNPYEFVKYQVEFIPTVAEPLYLSEGKTLESYRDTKGVDWQNEMFSNNPIYINDLSIRGGSAQTQYSISGSAYNQTGILLNTGHNRYQGRIALNHNISDRLKTGVSINYSKMRTHGQTIATGTGTTASFSSNLMFRTWGYRPLSTAGGDFINEPVDPDFNSEFDIRLNPVISTENDYTTSSRSDLLANMFVTYKASKNLEIKSTLSMNNYNNVRELFYNSFTLQGSPLNLSNIRGINGSIASSELTVLSNENIVTYQKTINKIHNFTAMGGFSAQTAKVQNFGFSVQDIENEQLGISGLDQGVPYLTTSVISDNTLVSTYGRLNYNYKSKYYFTGTLRGDGSSKFAPGNRWGIFPSAGLAWNMHQEKFIKEIPVISYAKFRASYGVIGNNRVSDFPYLSTITMPLENSYSFNNSTPRRGSLPGTLGNRDLKWESTAQANAGLDVNFLKNKIKFVFDIYQKNTTDLLLNADMPLVTGYRRAFKNIGELRNRGMEFTLTTVNIEKDNFRWESNFNISFNKNKIMALTQNQDALFSIANFHNLYNTRSLYVSEIGQPAGMMYGFVFDGVYQYEDFDNPSSGVYQLKEGIPTYGAQVQPGSIKYRDLDNDGVITEEDQTVIGRGQPVHIGGFNNNFTYKNFDLNIFLQWSYGNDIYNANRLLFEGNSITIQGLNQFASYNDRWTPENPSNTLHRATGGGPAGYHSSRVVEDGSYLRIKTISFGYNFQSALIKRLSMSNLRINFSAQNLLTFTNYSGMDPEVSVRNSALTPGFDFSPYPQPRTVVFGLNATF